MARPKTAKPHDANQGVDAELIKQDAAKLDELNRRLHLIEETYGDGSPFDLEKSIAITQIRLASSAESLLLAGKELIRIKEHVPHGDFIGVLEGRLNLNRRTAQRMMQAAVKFLEGTPRRQLAQTMGPTKLLDLITEEDDDLDALAEGGTLAGHHLDELETMSRRELLSALREAREKAVHEKTVHEKQLSRKDQKINDLDRQLHDREAKGWPFGVDGINVDITSAGGNALEQMDLLDGFTDQILQFQNEAAARDQDSEAAFESMATTYYDACVQVFNKAHELMHNCHEVFGEYKHRARPMFEPEDQ